MISSVSAGIFEFAEDTEGSGMDISDNSNDLKKSVNDKDKKKNDDVDDSNYEVKKFKLKISDSKDIEDEFPELYDFDENTKHKGVIKWLSDLSGYYVTYNTDDGSYLIMNFSESYEIPDYDSDYDYNIIECKVVEKKSEGGTNYYLVKDVKLIKQTKDSTLIQKTESSSSYKSDSDESSSKSSSEGDSYRYIGNAATGKFHFETCHDVGKMDQSNMVFLQSRDDAINQGYSPCGHCHP